MKNLPRSITDFSVSSVEFTVCRIESSDTVWFNQQACESVIADAPLSATDFQHRFAYGVTQCLSFRKLVFSPDDTLIAKAERYGGFGVAQNGGGARCGNFNGAQVKGLGPNLLAGKSSEIFHSYGGLLLPAALMELINSECFNNILPVGCIRSLGLIKVGAPIDLLNDFESGLDDSLSEEDRQRLVAAQSALLVREIAIRPGHFLRNHYFRTDSTFFDEHPSDIVRLRFLHKQLASNYASTEDFLTDVSKFARACGQQFGFSRIFRIYHGGLSPSNIALDGRWLDVAGISFLPSGYNVSFGTEHASFYEEPIAIADYLQVFLETYAKYNNLSLPIEALIGYYWQIFEQSVDYYFPMIFGLPKGHCTSGQQVKNALLKTIMTARTVTRGMDNVGLATDDDPVNQLVIDLFSGLQNSNTNGKLDPDLMEDFRQLVQEAYGKQNQPPSYYAFIKNAAVTACKIHYYRSFFSGLDFITRMDRLIETIDNTDLSQQTINALIDASVWIFTPQSSNILFLSDTAYICYEAENNYYVFHSGVEKMHQQFMSESALIDFLREHEVKLEQAYFSFNEPLISILNNVKNIMTA